MRRCGLDRIDRAQTDLGESDSALRSLRLPLKVVTRESETLISNREHDVSSFQWANVVRPLRGV